MPSKGFRHAVLPLLLLLIQPSVAERMQLDTARRLESAAPHNHNASLHEAHQVPSASQLQDVGIVDYNGSVHTSDSVHGLEQPNASSLMMSGDDDDSCAAGMIKVSDCGDCQGSCKGCYEKQDIETAIICVGKHFGSSCTSSKSFGHWTKKCKLHQVMHHTAASSGGRSGGGAVFVWIIGVLVLLGLLAGVVYLVKYHLDDSPPQDAQAPGSMPPPPQQGYSMQSNFGLAPPVNGGPPPPAVPPGYYEAPPSGQYDAPPSGYYNAPPPASAGYAEGGPPPSGYHDAGAAPTVGDGQPPMSGYYDPSAAPPGTGMPMQPEGAPPPAGW